MSEITYYVAPPFVASEDGVATGEPTNASIPRPPRCPPRRFREKKATSVLSPPAAPVTQPRAILAMQK
jgi:hypothetical protein